MIGSPKHWLPLALLSHCLTKQCSHLFWTPPLTWRVVHLRLRTTAGNCLQCVPTEPFICVIQSLSIIIVIFETKYTDVSQLTVGLRSDKPILH